MHNNFILILNYYGKSIMNNLSQNKDFSVFGMNIRNFFKSCGCCGSDRDDPQNTTQKLPNQPKNFPQTIIRGQSYQEDTVHEGLSKLDLKDQMIQEESDLSTWHDSDPRNSLQNPQIRVSVPYPLDSMPVFHNPYYNDIFGPDASDYQGKLKFFFLIP